MSNKTSKSLTKRIRITRTGKLIRRPMSVDHFRMSKSKKVKRQQRNNRSLGYSAKKMSKVLTYTS